MTYLNEQYTKMGKNFMTPDVIRAEQYEDRILELSKGDWMGQEIFGVSEFRLDDNKIESTRRGEMFENRKEAEKHYTFLKLNLL